MGMSSERFCGMKMRFLLQHVRLWRQYMLLLMHGQWLFLQLFKQRQQGPEPSGLVSLPLLRCVAAEAEEGLTVAAPTVFGTAAVKVSAAVVAAASAAEWAAGAGEGSPVAVEAAVDMSDGGACWPDCGSRVSDIGSSDPSWLSASQSISSPQAPSG